MPKLFVALAVASLTTLALADHHGARDNTLTDKEEADGYKLIFNGKDFDGWMLSNGKPIKGKVTDGTIPTKGIGGYVVMYDKPVGDFVLKCDVKMQKPHGNSGIFFRVANPKNPVHTGFEAQVYKGGTGMHDFGALYDLVPAKVDALNGPGEWNRVELTCKGPHISVKVNGKLVSEMNTDDWTTEGKRPDGSKHKFKFGKPISELHRSGYFGFQDHGANVWFKNVKLKVLDAPAPE